MKKIFKATVVNSYNKTAKVTVERILTHKKYNKQLRMQKSYIVDNSDNVDIKSGDIVEIEETKPMSKLKSFKIHKVLQKNDTEI